MDSSDTFIARPESGIFGFPSQHLTSLFVPSQNKIGASVGYDRFEAAEPELLSAYERHGVLNLATRRITMTHAVCAPAPAPCHAEAPCHPDTYCPPQHAESCSPACDHACDSVSFHLSLDVGLDIGHDCGPSFA